MTTPDPEQNAREVLARHQAEEAMKAVREQRPYQSEPATIAAMLEYAALTTPTPRQEEAVAVPAGMKPWAGGDSAPDVPIEPEIIRLARLLCAEQFDPKGDPDDTSTIGQLAEELQDYDARLLIGLSDLRAIEAAARSMCDRVNGIGDYDENIEQRRPGWLPQARAGIAAYLGATPDTAPLSGEDAPDFALTHPEVYDMANGEDAPATTANYPEVAPPVIAPGGEREASPRQRSEAFEQWRQGVAASQGGPAFAFEAGYQFGRSFAQPRQPDETVERDSRWLNELTSANPLNACVDAIQQAEGALARAAKGFPDVGSCPTRAVIDCERSNLRASRRHILAARAALATPADDGEQRG